MFQIRLQVFSYLRRKEGHAVDIALLGNGTVAKGLISHLQSQKNKGCELFSIRHILLKPDESLPDPVFTSSIDTILNDKDVSIVVEAMGGRHPAFEYLKAAILSKKHVVTSNKELVSFHGAELARLAQENQVAFFFSAAVGGGIPLLAYLRDTAQQETILEITGILNGTTNFILDAMTRRNLDFKDALYQAQKLGYAEADPTNDVEGFDLLYKLRIASCVAFGQWIDKESIARLPLHTIAAGDIEFFRKRDMTIRYLVNTLRNDNGFVATIQPTAVSSNGISAQIQRNNNLFLCRSDRSGEQILVGQGAGALPTAGNIHRDLQRISKGERMMINGAEPTLSADNGKLALRYYIRLSPFAAEMFPMEKVTETFETDLGVVLITHPVSVTWMFDRIDELRVIDARIFVCAIQTVKEGE
jgi:homoserine dehydrogenase